MNANCIALFVATALLGTLLQGCGQHAAHEEAQEQELSKAQPEWHPLKAGETCTVQKALEGIKINGYRRKLSEFEQEEGCVLIHNVDPDQFDRSRFDRSYEIRGEVLPFDQAGTYELKEGNLTENQVYLDCQSNSDLVITLDLEHTTIYPTRSARRDLESSCFHEASTEPTNAFPGRGEERCTVQRALEMITINGHRRTLEEFEQEAGCVMMHHVNLHKLSKGGAASAKPVEEYDLEGTGLPFSEAGSYRLRDDSDQPKRVWVDCRSTSPMVFRLDSNYVSLFVVGLRSTFPSCSSERSSVTIARGFPPPNGQSLIQHLEVNPSNLQSSSNLHGATHTREVVTMPQGKILVANTTVKSSQPIYRMPRAKRIVNNATFREMMKLAPEASAHVHLVEDK